MTALATLFTEYEKLAGKFLGPNRSLNHWNERDTIYVS